MPASLRDLIFQSSSSDAALEKLVEEIAKIRLFKSLIATTQAIDIVEGGIKANALPEQALAVVNHRIAVFRSVARLDQW
jgi:Gly-Xaa carboxypeptidase